MSGFISIDGVVSLADLSSIPANDRFLLYGDGLYELMASENGKVLDLKRHLIRIRQSASNYKLPVPWSDEELQFEIEHLISLSSSPTNAIRLIVSRGLGFSPRLSGTETSKRYIYCIPDQATNPEDLVGLSLKSCTRPHNFKKPLMKTNNYLSTIAAQMDAKAKGFDDICWTNAEGELLEAGFANIFLIAREGDFVEVSTPPIDSGILPGVTRQRVIDLLNNAGLPVTQRIICSEELAKFDEAFLTSSLKGLMAVQFIDRHRLHTLRKNSVFRHILKLYSTWRKIEVEIARNTDERH